MSRQPATGHHLPYTKLVSITIALPPEIFDEIRELAVEGDRSFSNMTLILLRKALNGNKQ